MHRFLYILGILLLSISCRDTATKSGSPVPHQFALSPNGENFFLFSGTDITFSSSTLYALNLETGKLSTLLNGQSSDLFLKKMGGRVFMFNRQASRQSFREIILKYSETSLSITFSNEASLNFLKPGDPHDSLLLPGTNSLLLINHASDNLTIIDLNKGSHRLIDAASLSIFNDQPLRMESITQINEEKIAILKQGIDKQYSPDHSQQVLFFNPESFIKSGGKLITDEVPLVTTTPTGLYRIGDYIYTLTICTSYIDGCHSGLEKISVTALRSQLVTVLNHDKFEFSGQVVFAAKRQKIYASVMTTDRSRKVIEIDPLTGHRQIYFHFPNRSTSGYWGLFYNSKNDQILVSDALSKREGELIAVDRNGKVTWRSKLPAIPYSGVLLSGE